MKTQKVTSALRKAGFTARKWNRATQAFDGDYKAAQTNRSCVCLDTYRDNTEAIHDRLCAALLAAGLTISTPLHWGRGLIAVTDEIKPMAR